MSTSKQSTRSWWAVSSTRARLTVVGASALALGLLTTSTIVWISPAATVAAEAIIARETDPRAAALVDERNELLSQIVDLQAELDQRDSDMGGVEARLADIQQRLWTAEGKLAADAGAEASASKPVTRQQTTRTPSRTTTASAPSGQTVPVIDAPMKSELLNPATNYFGMYTEQAPFNWATYDATASKLGSAPNVVGYFGGWDEAFRANAVTRSWQRDALPILTWESRPIADGNDVVVSPAYSLPKIIGDPDAGVPGDFDAYLHQYARDIVATGLPLGIRLDHEMNGVWYPWAERAGNGSAINGNNVGDYVKMWRHVHDIFQQEGANDLVIWIWSPNVINNLPSANQKSAFLDGLYPGDDYVDWVGLSGYLRPAYKADNDFTFGYTFDRSIAELRRVSDRPIFLAEVGASETGGHKAKWVESMFAELAQPENADIIGLSWFNLAVTSYVEGQRATNDWRIDARADTTAAFREGLALPAGRFRLATL